jgi:LPXTG-motif cell wall-anchored protein
MTVRGIIVSAAALALVSGGAAGAATIDVTPSSSHPGERVHISVPGCSAGPTAHIAVSPAFTGNVTLFGKADTGDADPVIRQELKPGVYPITAYCGASTVQGQISIIAGDRPSAGDGKTNNWLLLVVALVIAGVAGVFLIGRRRRPVS